MPSIISLSSYRKVLFLLASLLLAISLLLLLLSASPFLSSSGIFEHTMAQQQHNMVVHVAFSSLMYSYASTLINNNSSSTTVIPAQSNNFSLYNNSTYGIKFQSPYGWNKIEILTGRTTFVEFTSPSRNATGSLEPPAQVVISIEKGLGNVTTLQQYSKAADKLLNTILGNFNATSQPSTLSGLPAISKVIAMKHPVSGIDIVTAQVFAIKNDNAYSITYAVPASSYYRYLPIVTQIFNSFQIAGSIQTPTPTPPLAVPPASNTPATTSPPAIPSQPECVPGFHWDNSQRQCVPS